MRIHSKIVIDLESGRILEDEAFDYSGPLALCDRSLAATGRQAAQTANQMAGNYGAQAGSIFSNIVPGLEKWTTAPPGFGPTGLAQMETQAGLKAAAATGAAQEQSKLNAMRTGNVAGLGTEQAAEAEGASRAQTSSIQDILAQNAMLKSKQQQQAFGELGNLYGTAAGEQVRSASLVPEDISATAKAEQTGWLQNLMGILGGAGQLGAGYGLATGKA